MKSKIIYLAITALSILCGCNQKMSVPGKMDGQVATVNFNVPVTNTKSLALSSEEAVNSLQVFVFGMDGKIDAYKSANAGRLSLTCTTGEKEIFALVNAGPRSDVRTKSDLLGLVTDLKENNDAGLVMEGYIRTNLTPGASVSIPVSRNVARISLQTVTSDFELDVHRKQEFKIKRVMLINVAGNKKINGNSVSVSVDEVPTLWYNKMGFAQSPLQMLCDEVSDVPVTEESPYQTKHYFYCYPNPTSEDVSGGVWSERYTRLVVSATLDGVLYHYPVSIPQIKANTCYDVSLKVTRPGSSTEDEPVEKLDASIIVTVSPWGETNVMQETI